VYQTDLEGAQHTLVTGGSGSGKTTTMLIGMRDVIRLGRGLVVVDCKGGPDIPEQLAAWAARYDRTFHHWLIHDPKLEYTGPAAQPGFYDPISRGDASRRKDLLIGSQRWDVEYFKSEIGNYLQTLFRVTDLVPPLPGVDTFTDVADMLSVPALRARAGRIDALANSELAASLTRLGDMDVSALSGIRNMYSRFHTLTSSSAGAWLRKDPAGLYDIDLRSVADNGGVVVFSLDSSNYKDTASLIAGLIIQDLVTLSSELRHNPAPTPTHIYVDEFSAIDTVNMISLLNKARDSKMPVTISTQTLADLDRLEATFSRQVSGVISSFLVHRSNTEEEATFYAGLSGIRRKTLERTGFEQTSSLFGSLGSAAGKGSGVLEEKDDYAILPGQFQSLDQGSCIYIAMSPKQRYVHPIKVVRENPHVADRVHGLKMLGSVPPAGVGVVKNVVGLAPEVASSGVGGENVPSLEPGKVGVVGSGLWDDIVGEELVSVPDLKGEGGLEEEGLETVSWWDQPELEMLEDPKFNVLEKPLGEDARPLPGKPVPLTLGSGPDLSAQTFHKNVPVPPKRSERGRPQRPTMVTRKVGDSLGGTRADVGGDDSVGG